ncbi:subtilase-type protease inhibitor [Streptomyces syringium]|uniref:subtilase-type protease inhibitor n=1 Tax=Streptomyces TaxID=1883 RepID=UPI00341486B4
MRYITGGIALGAAVALGGLLSAGTAATAAPSAQTQSLFAPSALVLTVGEGESAADSGVQRAVTLNCTPKASGTHPAARAACDQLRAVDGDFKALVTTKSDRICTKEYRPIVITAEGVWDGHRVSYEHKFANPCMASDGKGVVFEF